MLTLSQAQFADMEQSVALAFIERLTGILTRKFPELLKHQPLFVRITMVGNGLQVADGFGFTLENTLGAFVALQCETSADFYMLPQAEAILRSDASEQQRINRLLREVLQQTWDVIKRGADLRAWFEPRVAQQQPARIAATVCAAFPELIESHGETGLQALFSQAIPRAQLHRLEPDAGIAVYAAALAVYGTRLDEPGGPPWAKDIFTRPPRAPEKIVALLRLRLLLDTNRLV